MVPRLLQEQRGTIFMPTQQRSLLDIWKKFITADILTKLKNAFNDGNNIVGTRKSKKDATKTEKHLLLDNRKALQSFAVYIYICAKGDRSSEVTKNQRFKRKQINGAIEDLKERHAHLDQKSFVGRDSIETILSRVLFSLDDISEISKNFRSILDSVGQYAAGDEKLFHFSGDSQHSRPVPNKPREVGLMFYELACMLKVNGVELPYMMDILLHNGENSFVPAHGIVQRWVEAIKAVETTSTVMKDQNDPNLAWLVFNSNCTTSAVRDWLIEKGQKFIAFVEHDSFNKEASLIHRIPTPDHPNVSRSIWNHSTNEVYTYYNDAMEVVEKKFCIAWGLERTEDQHIVRACSCMTPAYSHCEQMLKVCDTFNSALHDKSWPHPRGGNGVRGDLGCHHDFIMACIMQNVRNAWFALNVCDPSSVSFEEMMTDLAMDIYTHSLQY